VRPWLSTAKPSVGTTVVASNAVSTVRAPPSPAPLSPLFVAKAVRRTAMSHTRSAAASVTVTGAAPSRSRYAQCAVDVASMLSAWVSITTSSGRRRTM